MYRVGLPPLLYVPKERMGEGTAVGPEGRRWWKDSDRGTKSLPAEPVSVVVLRPELCAAQEVPRTQEGAFFFTKKAYCVNQTLCVAESRKSVQTQPPLFPPLKSPSNNGIPKGRVHDAPPAAHLRIRRSRIPRCVVSRRTAERETASRGLALPNTQRSQRR